MAKTKTGAVWEDREVLFDLPFSYLRLRPGERIFDRIEPIEDTKGNSRMKGRMVVTSLRIIWHSLSSPRINLSIGLHCVQAVSTKVVNSGLRGTTQALYILAAYKTSKYEFIFTNLAPSSVRHYSSVVGVHKAYGASRLYRELKLRGAIISGKTLRLLPLEKILLNEHSIWNLSSDAGNLGSMLVTNIRVVWFADVNEAFNVSMPYITIESIAVRDSKFGQALVCVVRPTSGGYVLGFRADPPGRLQPLFAELQALHQAYTERPIFGVEINWGSEIAVRDSKFGQALVCVVRPTSGGYVLGFRADPPDRLQPLFAELQALHQAYTERPIFGVEINWGSEIAVRDSKFGQALVCVVRPTSGGYVLGFRADPPDRLQPLFAELQALHQAYTERPIFGVEINWGSEPAKPTSDDIEELEEIGEPRGEMGPNLYLASLLAQNKENTEVLPVYSPYLGLAIEPLKEGFTLKSLFEVQTAN